MNAFWPREFPSWRRCARRSSKIQAFVLSGFVAGVGGAAYAHGFSEIGVQQFAAQYSIDVVALTVVGGIGILSGPVFGVLLVKGLPAFVAIQSLALFATRLGLLLLILYFPGGVVQLLVPLRRLLSRASRTDDEPPAAIARTATAPRAVSTGEVLRASGITKRYGGLVAVDDVAMSVHAGETVGLIGPNGAGKTTLFEILAGFVRPDGGSVVLHGRDVSRASPEARAERGLILSFQDVLLFPALTVTECIQLALERRLPTQFASAVAGVRGRDRRRRAIARDVAGSMGLWAWRDTQVQDLSTGTRTIAELACLVALEPSVLLLDEPSSGIAQRETEPLGELLVRLKEQHAMTLVVIEHDVPLVMRLAGRIVAMDAGRVIAEGRPAAIRTDPLVVEAYLGGRIETAGH